MKDQIKRLLKYFYAKIISIKSKSVIMQNCNLSKATELEGRNKICRNTNICNSYIGFASYIGENSKLFNSKIGKFCSIAENVKLISGQHPTKVFVSTHPAFFSDLKQSGFSFVEKSVFNENKYADEKSKKLLVIGNDVWIGANVSILEGSIIGDGAIVATGAVVIGNLDPYTIYGGVPAKKIGCRFTDEEIEFLLKFKWWDKEENWLRNNSIYFQDIKQFIFNFKSDKITESE